MDLGAFSISLDVADLQASRDFYEKLGFEVTGGDESQNWLILRNGSAVVGLFQGHVPKNTLTFNPGLDPAAMAPLERFTDIREIAATLKERGIALAAEPAAEGPAHLLVTDPDGNPILVDQFFPAPKGG